MISMVVTGLAILALCSGASPSSTSQPATKWFPNRSNVPAKLLWPPPPPYNHTVKELPSASSAEECRLECIQYNNERVSPVSGWSRCQSFTWLPDGHRCVAIVDPDEWQLSVVPGAMTGQLHWAPSSCGTDADCSYNGVCGADARCDCAPAWRGDRCQTLALLPTTQGAGLRSRDQGTNTSSWGGAVLLDPATGLQHMWASEMLAHCGIETWTTNSHVVHATSIDGVTFHRMNETLAAFSHEPNVVRAPSGEWVMYWTGAAPGAPRHPPCRACSHGNTDPNSGCTLGAQGRQPTFMAWADRFS